MNNEQINLKTLSDRINYALQITGTKKADLSRAIGVKPQVIQFLCNSQTQSSRFTFEIATALGLNTRWLATGEGEKFIADDQKIQFLKSFTRIPLIEPHEWKTIFLDKEKINEDKITTWYPLKTTCKDILAIRMPDSSMEPIIQNESILFIKKSLENDLSDKNYVFSFLLNFDTFVIRQVVKKESKTHLVPRNSSLFKDIEVDNDVIFLGEVTDCFWHIRR